MPVRIDAVGDGIALALSGLPTFTSYTVTFWEQVVNDSAGTNRMSYLLQNATYGASHKVARAGDDVDRLYNESAAASLSANATTAEWVMWAITCSGTGAGNLIVRAWAASDADGAYLSASLTGMVPTGGVSFWGIGSNQFNEFRDARYCFVKVWNAALSLAELQAERAQGSPVRTSSLNRYHRLQTNTDNSDGSGNGRTASLAGSLTTEGTEPRPWIATPSGAVTLTSVHPTAANRITAAGDLAVGNILRPFAVGGGTAPAGLVTEPDARFYYQAGYTPQPFEVDASDDGGSTYGSRGIQSISPFTVTPLAVGCGTLMTAGTVRGGGGSGIVVTAGASVFGTLTAATVDATQSARTARWLPTSRQPVAYTLDARGQRVPVYIDEHWYRFFDEIAERRLGGVDGPALPDVKTNAETAVAAAASVASIATAAQQTADASVQSLSQTKEVLVSADLPGAEYIEIPFFG